LRKRFGRVAMRRKVKLFPRQSPNCAREGLREARLGEIRAQVLIGLQQLDGGEGREWSLEAVEAKGREILASRDAE